MVKPRRKTDRSIVQGDKNAVAGQGDGSSEALATAEWVPIDSVTPDARNARVRDEAALLELEESIREFGQTKPVIVDLDGIVRAGNGTWTAMKRLGRDQVLIRRIPFRGAKAAAYGVKDNRTSDRSRFDDRALLAVLRDLKAEDEKLLRASGFDDTNLAALQDKVAAADLGELRKQAAQPADGGPAEPAEVDPIPPAEESARGGATLSIVFPPDQHRVVMEAIRLIRRREACTVGDAITIACRTYLEQQPG